MTNLFINGQDNLWRSSEFFFGEYPSTVKLLTPEDSFVNISNHTFFTWEPVEGALVYNLQVATDILFATNLVDIVTVLTSKELKLILGVKYFWRVRWA